MATVGRRFSDKVVMITGGGGAIGSAAAKQFASEGARIVLVDRDAQRMSQVADEIRQGSGAEVFAATADVAAEADVDGATADAVKRFGHIDVLFNNAGIAGKTALVHELAVADWDEIIRINLRGIFLVQRAVLRVMVAERVRGAVVNMSSSM